MELKKFKVNGLNVNLIQTSKFKTNYMTINFTTKLDKNNVTTRALLSYVLGAGCKEYPNRKTLGTIQETLYGLGIRLSTTKKGLGHMFSFDMSFVNGDYIDVSNLNDQSFRFAAQVLFNPLLVNGEFDKKIVENEKRILKNDLEAVIENKTRYSLKKVVESLFSGDSYEIPSMGLIEDIAKITPKMLADEYNRMLSEDYVELYFVGDIEESELKDLLGKYLKIPKENPKVPLVETNEINKSAKVKEIKENQKIEQSYLALGYKTDVRVDDDDYFANVILNGILGAYPHSKLFINVREKHSLSYSVFSNLEGFKGFLTIFAGIDSQKYDFALKVIREQVEAIKQGQITPEELESTKLNLISSINELADSPHGLIGHHFLMNSTKQNYTLERLLQIINSVTIEDVIRVSKHLTEHTVYFLNGEAK